MSIQKGLAGTNKKIIFLALLIGVVAGVSYAQHAFAGASQNASGFAWGGGAATNGAGYDGMGWFSFNNLSDGTAIDYGVNIPTTGNGNLSGYAWSENYGWLSFYDTDLAGCVPALSQAKRSGNSITGGARILGIRDAMSVGNAGGFDGCVSLSGSSPNYGVTISNNNLSGYGWSSDLGWIDFTGVTIPPTGSLTLPASCLIASGASTCTVTAVWSTANTTSPNLFDVNMSSILSSLPNSSGFTVWVAYPYTDFRLRDGTIALDPTTGAKRVTSSCETGSVWRVSSGKCVANATSGTIDASPKPCTVALGASTCSTNLTWDINAPNPNVRSSYTGGNISTNPTGNNVPATVAHNGTTFDARNSNSVLNTVTVTGTCASGSEWSGGVCAAQPDITFWADPSTIDTGQSTKLFWSSTNADSCTAAGTPPAFATGNATSNQTGVSVGPLTTTTSYAITCTGPGGSTNANVTVTVTNPNVSITASPSRVPSGGGSSTISWSASQVSSCSINGPGLSRTGLTDSQLVTVTAQGTYTIICQTNSSTISKSVTVNIGQTLQEF